MTIAAQADPSTAMELLFGQAEDQPRRWPVRFPRSLTRVLAASWRSFRRRPAKPLSRKLRPLQPSCWTST